MKPREKYADLTEYLKGEGHTEAEIDKILLRVERYDRETQLDSVMDSIGNGTLDLATLIREALQQTGPQ